MPSQLKGLSSLTLLLFAPAMISAQLTHGKKPVLLPPDLK